MIDINNMSIFKPLEDSKEGIKSFLEKRAPIWKNI